ncbi:MAG: 4-alpha-glucanotransferase [Alphaproteobacteria bacterium]|jgi:4-alpha-glucanotransferase|nr:4-alpha-glucanotransferase [Alphaproteobacteria bacterium]
MDRIDERAALLGIATEYRDARGQPRRADADTLSLLIDVLSLNDDPAPRFAPATVISRRGHDTQVRIEAPAGVAVHWEISGKGPITRGEGQAPTILLPHDLPIGSFQLRLTLQLPDGEKQERASLLVTPAQAYQGDSQIPHRLWGLAVQLYGVRSRRNWGHGDFTDLLHLADLAGQLGAAAIGLNPLHALFDDHPEDASPYSPNSRLFINPLYIDVEALPEFPGLTAAGLQEEVEHLRHAELVDYQGVANAKTEALHLAFAAFHTRASAERQQQFEAFRQDHGATLRRYACFELLRRRLGNPWSEWPAEWRDLNDDALARLQHSDGDGIAFFEYVQWIAHAQLRTCCERIHELGLPIGLYLDVAVGVRSDGFDAWSERDAVLSAVSVGAPPDALNTAGQDWGLAGINPIALEQRQFEPFRRMLQASMRHSGAIRLDHVLGLKRLFLVPKGMRPDQGTYVCFPFEALLAVTAQESLHHKCIVIGEDLGTVPENFRETLADWGIWSYQVMMFERDWSDGTFLAPKAYKENALVTFATHDLPTFAGWTTHRDLAVKRQLGLDPGESDEDRDKARKALSAALGISEGANFDFSAVAQYLAGTPSRLLVVTMEDALGMKEQPNLPGTVREYPNWRRRLTVAVEDLRQDKSLKAIAGVMASAGRSASRRSPTGT